MIDFENLSPMTRERQSAGYDVAFEWGQSSSDAAPRLRVWSFREGHMPFIELGDANDDYKCFTFTNPKEMDEFITVLQYIQKNLEEGNDSDDW